jgi:hypothetical protein
MMNFVVLRKIRNFAENRTIYINPALHSIANNFNFNHLKKRITYNDEQEKFQSDQIN